MSRAIFEMPTIRPLVSLTGEIVSERWSCRPVFADTNCLEVIDPLAAPQPGQNLRLFLQSLGRNEDGDRTTDNLVRGIAEKSLGASSL